MAEEDAKHQMIQCALTRTTESDDGGRLARVGRQRNAGIRRMGIELPPLNAALVDVHRELVRTTSGAKDMAAKNKSMWKTVKQTQAKLQKANERIAELERSVTTAPPAPSTTVNAETQELQEEV